MKTIRARINVLKLLLLFPILLFHSFVGLIGIENLTDEPKYSFWNRIIEVFGNEFFGSFGYFIACLSFFTYGFYFDQPKAKSWVHQALKFLLLFACLLSSQFDFTKSFNDAEFFTWNLYSFILLSFLLVYLLKDAIQKKPRVWFYVWVLCFTTLPLMNDSLRASLHQNLSQALIPIKVTTEANSWFLLPWIFGPLLFYTLGVMSAVRQKINEYLITLALLIAGSAAYFYQFRPYYFPFSLELNSYYMSFFWQSISVNNMKVFSFAILLMLWATDFFKGLEENFILRKLRYLQWCKNFWFCYILHLGMKDIIGSDNLNLMEYEFVFNYSWLIIFICTELLAQVFFVSLYFYRHLGRSLIAKLRIRNS